jgi:hypothetical protein
VKHEQAIKRLGMPTSPLEEWLAKARLLGVTYEGESPAEIERQKKLAKELLDERDIPEPCTECDCDYGNPCDCQCHCETENE